jgi:hypothetical protein
VIELLKNLYRLPGFVGNFKCTSTTGDGCQTYSLGKSASGDFTYDYSPNAALLSAAGLNNATKRMALRRLE